MFIKDVVSISPQNTYTNGFIDGDIREITDDKYIALEPSYTDFIPNNLLRRMGKAVRMGIGAGMPLIQRYPNLDGIILGTANGGLEDCIKFLNQLVEYEEGVLTPTNFVQSTPNAVAGQLALMSQNRGYNSTHTHGSLAFESALVDAELFLLESSTSRNVLLGGLEEISGYNFKIDHHNKLFKDTPCSNLELLNQNSTGSICGEGAHFFLCSNDSEDSVMRVVAQQTTCFEGNSALNDFIDDFVARLDINNQQPTMVLHGWNGDNRLAELYSVVQSRFEASEKQAFKHLSGEYRTAVAFALYLSFQFMQGKAQHVRHSGKTEIPKTILIYNTFDGKRHSLILLERVAN